MATAESTGREAVSLWSLFQGVVWLGLRQRPLPSPKVVLQILKAEWGEVGANALAYPPLALGSVLATGEAEPVAVMFSTDPPAGENASVCCLHASPRLLMAPPPQKAGLGPCNPWVEPHQPHEQNLPMPVTNLGCQTGTSGLQ